MTKDNCGDELASSQCCQLVFLDKNFPSILAETYFFFRYVGSFNVFTIMARPTWPDRQDVGIVSLSMQRGREGGRALDHHVRQPGVGDSSGFNYNPQ